MASYTTVRDVLLREFVGASEGDAVSSAAQLLLDEQATTLVVLRGTDPVGLVGLRDLLGQYLDGTVADATLADVMETDYETIDPDVSVSAAVDRFVGSSQPLLVVDNGELVGLLTERDLLSASYEERDEQLPPTNNAEAGAAANSANQGICESCGAFTQTLTVSDGQTLCSDCRDM